MGRPSHLAAWTPDGTLAVVTEVADNANFLELPPSLEAAWLQGHSLDSGQVYWLSGWETISLCGSYRAGRASLREVMNEEAESQGGDSKAILSQPRILTIYRTSQGTRLFPSWTEEWLEDGSIAASVTQAPGQQQGQRGEGVQG